jgi:hypothetical protein
MSRTLADLNREMTTLYGTEDNDFSDFPVGTPVKIITCYQDCYFFYGETGKVIRNSGKYLGIIVEFDEPRHFESGYIQKEFNFQPGDLALWNEATQEIHHEQEKLKKLGKEKRAEEEENIRRSERFRILDL